jgi:imidazolonepropionase-like amidohydrolase
MVYECHGHIILDGVTYAGAVARHKNGVDEMFLRENLKTCAENGIVFYRDGGDKHGVSLYAKKIAHEYGIDYRSPAYIIHKKGYYGGMFGRSFESMSEYRGLVAEAKRLGADFIKITASGMLDFAGGGDVLGPALTTEELGEMVQIAHGEGFSVMVHANGPDNIKRAAESGADSIEHGYYMDDDAIRMMVQTGAVWVPTCATASNLIGSGRYDDTMLERILNGHKDSLKKTIACGVKIACGSDAGAVGVPQGAGTLDELAILESLGIDPKPGNRIIEEVFRRKC